MRDNQSWGLTCENELLGSNRSRVPRSLNAMMCVPSSLPLELGISSPPCAWHIRFNLAHEKSILALALYWVFSYHGTRNLMCGSNSVVECQLPKLDVAGSSPVSRSNFSWINLPQVGEHSCSLRAGLCVSDKVRHFRRDGK